MATEAKVDNVTAVLKVMAIMEALDECGESSLAALSQRAVMSKSTAYRFLQTLKNLGYVAQNPETEKYRLTMKVFALGSTALGETDLIKTADPDMAALSEETREAIHLGVLDTDTAEVIYVHKYNSHFNLCMQTRIGDRTPAYTNSIGKALLAHLPAKQLDKMLAKISFEPRTQNTVTTEAELRKELAKISAGALSEDLEEMDEGVCCFATPIFNHTGKAIAALSMSIPSIRYHQDKTAEYKRMLIEAGKNISHNLGYLPSRVGSQ